MSDYDYGSSSVKFWEVRGRVANNSKRSETNTSSSTDGKYVTNIRSSTTTKQEFWLIKDDGTEVPIQLSGSNIPVRDGHEVSAIAASINGSEISPVVALVNHTARQAHRTFSKKSIRNNIDLTVNPKYAWIALVGSLILSWVSVGLSAGTESLALGIFAIIIFLVFIVSVVYLPFNIVRHFRASSAFYDDIQWIANQVLEGNKDVLEGPTKSNRVKSKRASFLRTATGLPLGIALVIGYGPSTWSIASYAMDWGLTLSDISLNRLLLGNAPQFILAWIVLTGLFYGYRRWRKQ